MTSNRNSVAAEEALRAAETEATNGTVWNMYPTFDPGAHADDYPCGYGPQLDKLYWQDAPIDAQTRQSHLDWVNNRKQWSGTSSYLQESIEVVVPSGWIGLRTPEPVPQSCSRGEITEYGPADYAQFVTHERRTKGNPVLNPREMCHVKPLSFCAYGF